MKKITQQLLDILRAAPTRHSERTYEFLIYSSGCLDKPFLDSEENPKPIIIKELLRQKSILNSLIDSIIAKVVDL